jgi:hypothetical protein
MSGHRWYTPMHTAHIICDDCRLMPMDQDDIDTDCPVNDWGDEVMETVLRDLIPDLYCVPDLEETVTAIKEDERWDEAVKLTIAECESTEVIALMHEWGYEQGWPKTQGPEATGHDWIDDGTGGTVCARCKRKDGDDE